MELTNDRFGTGSGSLRYRSSLPLIAAMLTGLGFLVSCCGTAEDPNAGVANEPLPRAGSDRIGLFLKESALSLSATIVVKPPGKYSTDDHLTFLPSDATTGNELLYACNLAGRFELDVEIVFERYREGIVGSLLRVSNVVGLSFDTGCQIAGSNPIPFEQFPRLQYLHLGETNEDFLSKIRWADLGRLEQLRLNSELDLPIASVEQVLRAPALKRIGASGWPDQAYALLAGLGRPVELDIRTTDRFANYLEWLANSGSTKTGLELYRKSGYPSMPARGWSAIGRLKKVRAISLCGVTVGNGDLQLACNGSRLTIDLFDCRVVEDLFHGFAEENTTLCFSGMDLRICTAPGADFKVGRLVFDVCKVKKELAEALKTSLGSRFEIHHSLVE